MITTFKGYIEDGIRDEITDFTVDSNCSSCGNCCNNALPMNKKEIDRVKKYVKSNNINEIKNVTPLAKAPLDMTCPFRDSTNNVCTIYEVRPKVCRSFICNKPEEAKRNREKFANTMRIIDLRKEFFNS
jgi:Fe-S-cluster containining protein